MNVETDAAISNIASAPFYDVFMETHGERTRDCSIKSGSNDDFTAKENMPRVGSLRNKMKGHRPILKLRAVTLWDRNLNWIYRDTSAGFRYDKTFLL